VRSNLRFVSHSAYKPPRHSFLILAASILIAVTGCTSMPLKEGGTLTSYDNLGAAKGKFGKKRRHYVDSGSLSQV
jgi:hypothetical protein